MSCTAAYLAPIGRAAVDRDYDDGYVSPHTCGACHSRYDHSTAYGWEPTCSCDNCATCERFTHHADLTDGVCDGCHAVALRAARYRQKLALGALVRSVARRMLAARLSLAAEASHVG